MVSSSHIVQTDPAQSSILPQQVRRALAYMRANLPQRVTLAELAAACAISERALLKQFERFLGVSPIAHLLRMRLTAARAELQRSDGAISISDVASRYGLAHLGRFAAEYRKAFGELPSTTLRRARRTAVSRSTGSGHETVITRDFGSPRVPFVARQRPSLVILALRTETLQERLAAQELAEQLAVTLSRASVASVTFADATMTVARQISWSPKGHAGTQYCLHGRLAQRGGRIRVTLWLTDAVGRHVWGDSYDGATDSMFEFMQLVADHALCGVVPGITGAEIARICDKDPQALAAREMVMQAFPLLMKIDAENARKTLVIASRAMEMDPDDALPVAISAYCRLRLLLDGAAASPVAMRAEVLKLAHRAGTLDAGDPLVTTARAAVATVFQSREEAEALVDRALAMDPTCGWAWERRGFLYCGHRPDFALACFDRAMQLHGPFMPRENCFVGINQAHYAAGRLEQAASWAHRVLAENPRAMMCHWQLVCFEERLGRPSAARRSVDELRRAHPHFTLSAFEQAFPGACYEPLARFGVPH